MSCTMFPGTEEEICLGGWYPRTVKSELPLDPNDYHACKMSSFPMYVGFVASKHEGGLTFHWHPVLRVVKATEVIFSCRVKKTGQRNNRWVTSWPKYSDCCFGTVGTSDFQCVCLQLTSLSTLFVLKQIISPLLKAVTWKYLNIRMKAYGTKYIDEVIHKNISFSRHAIKKQILIRCL